MRFSLPLASIGLACLLPAAAIAAAETKVEIKGVHLCCGACVKGVASAVEKVAGAKAACEQDTGSVTVTAPDASAAQKAVEAIAAAGYHGTVEGESAKFPETKDVPAGKVTSLKLGGIHNCCGACTNAVVEALQEVEGVKANTLKPRQTSFEVTGEFDASAVIKALHAAGFHPVVQK